MYDKIIFIDFDGTITSEDTLVGALRLFASKDEIEEKNKAIFKKEVTLSQVLREAFERTLSSNKKQILDYLKTVEIRDGFEKFLNYANSKNIPVVVISGGLDIMVDYKIGKYKDKIKDIYSVKLDTTSEYMKLKSDYDDGDELLKKTDIMKKYSYNKAICIGDSHTDVKMSLASDIVFARDLLVDYMVKLGKKFYLWNDFYDIITVLNEDLVD